MSEDHKPSIAEEMARIERAGEQIRPHPHLIPTPQLITPFFFCRRIRHYGPCQR